MPVAIPVLPVRKEPFLVRWRWRICCAGVAMITYAAIMGTILLPGNTWGENFLFMAFPAAMAQFLLIDFARNGFRVSGRREVKKVEQRFTLVREPESATVPERRDLRVAVEKALAGKGE